MNKLSTLWEGANYQDSLLQSYRSFHLTSQSILIAIGVGLTISIISIDELFKVVLIYILLLLISGMGLFLLFKMKNLISARGEDVDYFHNKIIEQEQELPKMDRVLTAFKVYQKFNREKTDIDEYFLNFELSEGVISQLTEKGKGHTRKLLDKHLFNWFNLDRISYSWCFQNSMLFSYLLRISQ